jgi:hypothetical protein
MRGLVDPPERFDAAGFAERLFRGEGPVFMGYGNAVHVSRRWT